MTRESTTRISHLKKTVRGAGSIVAAIALGGCLSAGVAFAASGSEGYSANGGNDTDAVYSAIATDGAEIDTLALFSSNQFGLHTDYAGDESTAAALASTFPYAFDLRHYNGSISYTEGALQSDISGGINYVSPVKSQNPFGTCWAFAITSSAETSLLTALDQQDNGAMDGSIDYEKAASGEYGKLAQYASNLSERHLAYFAFAHPTTYGLYSSQAGEGKYLSSGSTDATTILDTGGGQMLGMSIYASNIGPVPESVARYISDEGWIQVMDPGNGITTTYRYFTSLEKATEYADTVWSDAAIAAFNEKYGRAVTKAQTRPKIAKKGTWAIDPDKMYGVVAELENSNEIAVTHESNGLLSTNTMTAIKQELTEGHPIAVSFKADQSMPTDTITTGKSYLNTTTWAQYTYDYLQSNHEVTIVGYDDNYAASNFKHSIYKYDSETGKEVIDQAATDATEPAGPGAWIVKNSWGSTDNENPLYDNEWGIGGTGYFYLSYYDKSVSAAESYEFDVSEEAQERTSFLCYQYDLANVSSIESVGSGTPYKMANVYAGPAEGENSVAIRDLGFITGSPNDTSTLAVYVMDDADDPATIIDTTSPAATATVTNDKAGFHRISLNSAVVVKPGQKFAVTQVIQRENGTYEYVYDYGDSQSYVTAYNNIQNILSQETKNCYYDATINKGESLAWKDGVWTDWQDAAAEINKNAIAYETGNMKKSAYMYRQMAESATDTTMMARYFAAANACENFYVSSVKAIDNWSIKAYADEIEDSVVYRLYNGATSEHLWTTDLNEYSVLTDYGWTQEGAAWESPEDGVGVIRLYNPVLSKHLYTTDANEVSVLTSGYGWVKDNNGDPVFYSAQDSETGDALEGAVAIYRLYNGALSQHLLTRDTNEYAVLPRYGWSQEGAALYALS